MIINISRANQFQECRRKAYNWDELRLTSWREADPLIGGGGFHDGVAEYFSNHNAHAAIELAEKSMRDRYDNMMILPEERPMMEQTVEWTKRAVAKFIEHYDGQDIQVIHPEVKFCVPLPNTEHHCFFMHRVLLQAGLLSSSNYDHNRCIDPRCSIPHYFKGKTDALVSWLTRLWLFEHKTNSMVPDIFFKKYRLDWQGTGYIYGIQKSLGVDVSGFILNVIQKPYKYAKDQLAVGFFREPYLRSTEDLERFERELSHIAFEYEMSFVQASFFKILGAVYMNTHSCTNYNRECYYLDYCENHFEAKPDEFSIRPRDYVEDEYFTLAGIDPNAGNTTTQGEEEHAE